MSNELQKESFNSYLKSKGYFFNKELIENYLLSLKVKPFIILSGNSGTGKTKLSQLFAQYISNEYPSTNEINDEGYFSIKVKTNYSSWQNSAWTLPKDKMAKVIPLNECSKKFEMNIDGIPTEGDIKLLVQLQYDNTSIKRHLKKLYEQNPKGETDLEISCEDIKKFISKDYKKPNGSIILTQKANASAIEKRQWFAQKNIFDYYPFDAGYCECNIKINNIKTKAQIRITPKITFKKNEVLQNYLKEKEGEEVQLELKINYFDFENFNARWECSKSRKIQSRNDDKHYQIVPVGANWTDNTNIVGYYNVITEKYQSTPAYDLIKRANENPNDPYFLILDEMNLSHVERYFSDFLSSIESDEEIPLYGSDETLKLPKNLFIIGTVNVDETTYMFSPKVLDRANTIEFDVLSAMEYMKSDISPDELHGNIEYLQTPLKDCDVGNLNIDDLREIFSNIYCQDDNLWDLLAEEISLFQEALKNTGFDFGFRVINEILRFMLVSWRYENSPTVWNNWERYFDAEIKQKILTKLHGSEKAIGKVLISLFNLCLTDQNNNENPKNFTVDKNNSRYYTSALKLQNMTQVLSDKRYVSFIN